MKSFLVFQKRDQYFMIMTIKKPIKPSYRLFLSLGISYFMKIAYI